MSYTNNDSDKKWLVKKNNVILGPFNKQEVHIKLQKEEFKYTDYASVPGQLFWGLLIGYEEFNDLESTNLDKILKAGLTITKTFTNTITSTKKLNTQEANEEQNITSDSKITNISHQKIEEKLEQAYSFNKQKKYLFWFMVVFTVIIGAFVFKKISVNNDNDNTQLKYYDLGRDYFAAGNYKKAMQIWETTTNIKFNREGKKLFNTLRFVLKGDTSKINFLIKSYNNKNITQIIKASSQIKNDNFLGAYNMYKQFLDNISLVQINKAVLSNVALLSAKIKNCSFFDQYENEFNNLGSYTNLINFSYASCLLQLDTVSDKQTKKIQNLLTKITKYPQNYYQEALVGLVYIKNKNNQDVSPLIKNLLDTNPNLTNNYFYNIWVNKNIYSWQELLPFCKNIYSSHKENKLFISFYAYCLVRANNFELAQQFIKQAHIMDPKHALIKAVYAYITYAINLKDKSAELLGDAISINMNNQYILPHILQAQFLTNNLDWEQVIFEWKKVLKNNPNSISGLGGLAYAKYHLHLYTEAQEYINQGFSIDKTKGYSPLLFVSDSIKNNQ